MVRRKMKIPEHQKRLNRIEKAFDLYRTLTIVNVFGHQRVGLATLFQRLTRLANADDQGRCECISCGRVQQWNEMDGGHFISRQNKATIIDPDNVWPQCKYCNDHLSGNQAEYRKNLVAKIGEKAVRKLETAKLPKNHVWNRRELAEIKVDLQAEILMHEKRLGIK
jgi:hypothetical protein